MALPLKDNWVEEITRLRASASPWQGRTDALLEYAVMHGDEAEAARLREKLKRLAERM